MRHVDTGAVRLAVETWPASGALDPGRTVIGIHGLTANHTCWFSLAEALAPAWRVVAYDLRGRGDSDKPPTGYSLAEHGRDLLGLLDHLGIERALLMGHSLGAHIAVRFAAPHLALEVRLVFFDDGLDFCA